MREVLVKLADKFDQEGKHELATAVDAVILSTAARNKAPLKDLDKDVKKDLLKFLHTVQKNMKDSMDALHEFFRRLRYFDIGDTVKEMGLDKVLKEIEKTHSCVDSASKSLYTMSYGKRPSKTDLDQLADDFGLAGSEKPSPLSFFESQTKGLEELEYEEEATEERMSEEYLKTIHEHGGPAKEDIEIHEKHWKEQLEDISEEELGQFWSADEDESFEDESFEDDDEEDESFEDEPE